MRTVVEFVWTVLLYTGYVLGMSGFVILFLLAVQEFAR